MVDCHVETYRDGSDHTYGMYRAHYTYGTWRAQAVHTATGRVLYTTWPYSSEASAMDRARRWLREEYEKVEQVEFFGIPCEKRLN
jgi:hypothetical protein